MGEALRVTPAALMTTRRPNVVALDPPMSWAAEPFRIMVLAVVKEKVPLLTQLPLRLWARLVPPAKVVVEPMVRAPAMLSAPLAVLVPLPEKSRFP